MNTKKTLPKKVKHLIFSILLIFFLVIIIIPLFLPRFEDSINDKKTLINLKKFRKEMFEYAQNHEKLIYPSKAELESYYKHRGYKDGYCYQYFISNNRTCFLYLAFPTSPSNGVNAYFIDESYKFFKAFPLRRDHGWHQDWYKQFREIKIEWHCNSRKRISEVEWIEINPTGFINKFQELIVQFR